MEREFNLEQYMTAGVERIIKEALRATFHDPKESAFMVRYATASRKAAKVRNSYEEEGEHIPPFLIASITSSCNLHCAGCYARANHACHDGEAKEQMTADEWEKVFAEAKELGVGFILLAGGEPMLRWDVIEKAAEIPEILFPVFTNGTMLGEGALRFFDRSRNVIPVFSIEGDEDATDHRRGGGVYRRLLEGMELMKVNHLLFGASVTVTTENIKEVVKREFLDTLKEQGCKLVFYVEFVPVEKESAELAPGDKEREFLQEELKLLRDEYPEMVLVSFPGDEKTSGGCLAAGRGFFHINANGNAEPCPFSPYSDSSVRNGSLLDAMHSKLFTTLRDGELLMEEHSGGCVLYERKEQVEALL